MSEQIASPPFGAQSGPGYSPRHLRAVRPEEGLRRVVEEARQAESLPLPEPPFGDQSVAIPIHRPGSPGRSAGPHVDFDSFPPIPIPVDPHPDDDFPVSVYWPLTPPRIHRPEPEPLTQTPLPDRTGGTTRLTRAAARTAAAMAQRVEAAFRKSKASDPAQPEQPAAEPSLDVNKVVAGTKEKLAGAQRWVSTRLEETRKAKPGPAEPTERVASPQSPEPAPTSRTKPVEGPAPAADASAAAKVKMSDRLTEGLTAPSPPRSEPKPKPIRRSAPSETSHRAAPAETSHRDALPTAARAPQPERTATATPRASRPPLEAPAAKPARMAEPPSRGMDLPNPPRAERAPSRSAEPAPTATSNPASPPARALAPEPGRSAPVSQPVAKPPAKAPSPKPAPMAQRLSDGRDLSSPPRAERTSTRRAVPEASDEQRERTAAPSRALAAEPAPAAPRPASPPAAKPRVEVAKAAPAAEPPAPTTPAVPSRALVETGHRPSRAADEPRPSFFGRLTGRHKAREESPQPAAPEPKAAPAPVERPTPPPPATQDTRPQRRSSERAPAAPSMAQRLTVGLDQSEKPATPAAAPEPTRKTDPPARRPAASDRSSSSARSAEAGSTSLGRTAPTPTTPRSSISPLAAAATPQSAASAQSTSTPARPAPAGARAAESAQSPGRPGRSRGRKGKFQVDASRLMVPPPPPPESLKPRRS